MNRLGLAGPEYLSPEQEVLYAAFDELVYGNLGNSFTSKRSDGVYVGPFGVLLHTPAMGMQFVGMARALAALPGLPAQAREVAILVVGAHTRAAYEWMAHSRISGLSQADLELISCGRCPDGLEPQSKAAYRLAYALFGPGPVSDDDWRDAQTWLGRDGATAVVHYVGFYKYVSTLLNGFNVQLPQESNEL